MPFCLEFRRVDRKSTRLNSSHTIISYAVFCLKKKNRLVPVATPTHAAPGLTTLHRLGRVVRDGRYIVSRVVVVAAMVRVGVPLFFFLMNRGPPKIPLFPHPAPFRA